ncbi:SDR family oxidoreductase [Angustibacter aerolatus]
MRGLQGKVALVTGASRGIGFAAAERLVAEGARVAITARKAEPLAAAVEALGGPDVAIGVAGRADDAAHRDEVLARVTEAFGPLDLLVNNTGINPAYGPLADLDLDVARKITETNVVSTLAWTQASLRAGLADGGAVVNVSSIAGLQPAPGIAFYGVTKAALIQLTESLAIELAPAVRVNAVAPAVVKTQFAQALYAHDEEGVASRYPLRRLGRPDDVGAAIAFLLSDDASWITGQTLVLDGGITRSGGLG